MHDHLLKLQRARRHLKDLEAAEEEWQTLGHHTYRNELDAQGWTHFIVSPEQPPTYPVSVILGDCVHNLRAALDVLALSLAEAHTPNLSDDARQQSEFPIYGDTDRKGRHGRGAAMFANSGLAKIAGWHPKAQAIVEGFQPYQRGQAFRDDPLWLLHHLDILDKHRALHVCAAWTDSLLWDPDRSVNCDFSVDFSQPPQVVVNAGPVEEGTEIGRALLRPLDPTREMYVHPQNSLRIAFSPGIGALQYEPVAPKLGEIHAILYRTIIGPLEAFL